MKALSMLVTAAAVAGLLVSAQPARSGDDCDTVMDSLKEEVEIATKNFDASMEDLKKTMTPAADDKKKASIRNIFCSISGEYLGTARAFRAVSAECVGADKKAATLAALDQSIKQIELSLELTCK